MIIFIMTRIEGYEEKCEEMKRGYRMEAMAFEAAPGFEFSPKWKNMGPSICSIYDVCRRDGRET